MKNNYLMVQENTQKQEETAQGSILQEITPGHLSGSIC